MLRKLTSLYYGSLLQTDQKSSDDWLRCWSYVADHYARENRTNSSNESDPIKENKQYGLDNAMMKQQTQRQNIRSCEVFSYQIKGSRSYYALTIRGVRE